MCGITGILCTAGTTPLDEIVQGMADAIKHRGPDDGGVWTDLDAGIALGHRRLSVLDPSPAGHQPMVSPSGRFVIAFNGEIYNHLELRRALADFRPQGHAGEAWRGHSDTETLLSCFEAWGIEKTLTIAVGMFALVLWDRETRRLTLARDRMGEKPLYYGWQGDSFLFGSELKALKAHPDFRASVDRGVLALLLQYNYVPAPYSIYEGIHKLPAGTYLQLRADRQEADPVAYWSLGEVAEQGIASQFAGTDHEALDLLEQHLCSAVRGQMAADVPLGTLLSGGMDSTLITALMQSQASRPVRTFTIGFEQQEYDEADHARLVAKYLGTDHTELRLSSEDALALIPLMPDMYDEPFADSSQLPTHLVMKLARQKVTVALSGDGGDELFGGYNRYRYVPMVWKKVGWLPGHVRNALGAGLTSLPVGRFNRWSRYLTGNSVVQVGDKLHKLGQRLHDIQSIDDLYISLVSEWLQPGLVRGGEDPSCILKNRTAWPKIEDPVARMMALDGLSYLPDDILVKVDRAAMAASLETRAPFLDRDVVAFAWSLPVHMKIRNGHSKWLLRRLLDKYIPRNLLERPKMGFGIPLDDWLRGPLRDWAEGLISHERLQRGDYLDPQPIRKTWDAHQSGKASYGYRLWSVLMFQAWLEHHGISD